MSNFDDLQILDQLQTSARFRGDTRIRRFKGSNNSKSPFGLNPSSRISQWPRITFIRAKDNYNPAEELCQLIDEQNAHNEAKHQSKEIMLPKETNVKSCEDLSKTGEIKALDIVLFKAITSKGDTLKVKKIPEYAEAFDTTKNVEVSSFPEKSMNENVLIQHSLNLAPSDKEISSTEESEQLCYKEQESEKELYSKDNDDSLDILNVPNLVNDDIANNNAAPPPPLAQAQEQLSTENEDEFDIDDTTDKMTTFTMNKFADLSVLEEDDDDEDEDEELEGEKEEEEEEKEKPEISNYDETEGKVNFSLEDSESLEFDEGSDDYDYAKLTTELVGNTDSLAEDEDDILEEDEDEDEEELLAIFDASDDSEIEAYLSIGDTLQNDFTIYDYDSEDEEYNNPSTQKTEKVSQSKKGAKVKEEKGLKKDRKLPKKMRKAQKKLERKAGKAVAARMGDAFSNSLDDESMNLYAELQEQWLKDKSKKARRRAEREKLRSEGLLGKKSKKKLLRESQKPSSSDSDNASLTRIDKIFINDVYQRMQQFKHSAIEEISLPPCRKYVRRLVHALANDLNLKSRSYGSGNKRYTMLSKTHKFDASSVDLVSLTRIMERLQTRVEYQSFSKSGRKSRMTVSSVRSSKATRVYDGQIVGEDAPEISKENPGRRLLEKLGWYAGKGLGHPENEGSKDSLRAIVKVSRSGLG
ncbi:G-patch and R3H domain-containing protein C30B4.02c [Schizosaccharomyces pombe]|uniref:G-patch and R3H domain-containing protein C30B4.02c n=1 Tax=Schizosaccharomyces pombe (strain 972 / ATCC 24843) TaxID=284812 RepID=YND2_SCHPO|nr:G-patch and R3H domain-containing protein [Schizosaccharomyces pombe]O74363.1 RecName: Full=G-patch and R3H domain-containing protein C30B4.02c [Schizosaccharomyces pombe 972h-]CAA20315.1 R3H and G-patch domain, implicated in splicing (predicted) [Schizosaccharomyces pombe]|eukprot:NP_595527.1 G-patch and R3H domain-containing protein [Schizosaccharomyces pombe]